MISKMESNSSFEEEINKEKTILVDFYADWCGPCKMLAPILEEVVSENPDITIMEVNVDEYSKEAAEYNVMSIPTLILFEDGKEKKRKVGLIPKEEVLEMFN